MPFLKAASPVALSPEWAKTCRVFGCDTCKLCRLVGAHADLSGRAPRWRLVRHCWQWNVQMECRWSSEAAATIWSSLLAEATNCYICIWNLESQLKHGAACGVDPWVVTKWPFLKHLAHSPDASLLQVAVGVFESTFTWWKFLNSSKGTKQPCG